MMTSSWLSWTLVALVWCQWSFYLVSGDPDVTATTDDDIPISGERTFRLTMENEGLAVEKRSIAKSIQFKIPEEGRLDETESETNIEPLADFILRLLTTQIIKQELQEIPMPEIHKSEYLGKTPVGITVKLDAWEGSLKDLSSIKRVSNVKLARQGRFVVMEFDVVVQPLEFNYQKYEFKAGAVGVGGDVRGGAEGALVTLKLLVDIGKDSCNISLDDMQIDLMSNLDLQLTGLSPLDRFFSWITSKIANKFSDNILPQMAEIFRRDLQKLLTLLRCDDVRGFYFVSVENKP